MNDFYQAEKELIDIVDKKNKLTGNKEDLREAHFKSLWHRCSHVWIYNKKGEVLLSKRAAIKHYFPSLYDISTAGHQTAGEIPFACAIREAEEELGIEINPKNLDFIKTIQMSTPLNSYMNNEFYYVYLYCWNGRISSLRLKKNEVDKVFFLSLEDFKKEIDNDETYKKYVPHKKEYYYLVIKEIKKRLGNKHE